MDVVVGAKSYMLRMAEAVWEEPGPWHCGVKPSALMAYMYTFMSKGNKCHLGHCHSSGAGISMCLGFLSVATKSPDKMGLSQVLCMFMHAYARHVYQKSPPCSVMGPVPFAVKTWAHSLLWVTATLLTAAPLLAVWLSSFTEVLAVTRYFLCLP